MLGIILIGCLGSVSAVEYTSNAHGISINILAETATTPVEGEFCTLKAPANLFVIQKPAVTTATHCSIYWENTTLIQNGTFAGNNCSISINRNLTIGAYWFVVHSNGAAFDKYRTDDPSYPISKSTLFWNATKTSGAGSNFTISTIQIHDVANVWTGINTTWGGLTDINVSLTSPENSSIISTTSELFNVSLSMSGTNYSYSWNNNTYYIWFNNGTTFNTTLVSGLSTNATNISRNTTNFILGSYIWNSYACYSNTTFSNCSWGIDGNYTFQHRPFSLDSQTYTSAIYETSKQTYTANITTIPSILNVITKLNYNGTLKTATSTCSSGFCYINISFDIPLITFETENKTSYWNVTLFDGANSYSFNTLESNFTQNVSRLHLELCNATYFARALNFTAWNEKNLSKISLFSFAGNFETWLGSGAVRRNQSFQDTSTENITLCIAPNQTIFTDAQIRYAFDNENISYISRDYYFQNASLTNTSQDIRLYLLEAEDSTTFIVKVQDQKLSAVEDALVYIQRYYPEDRTYKTVQIAKTDSNGETIGFYEVEIPDYKHIIIKNGITLLETSPQKVVGKEVPFTLTFTVGEALDYPWKVFESNPNIITSLTYNDTTKLVTFTYVDSTGATTLGRLTILELSRSNNTIRVIYNSSSSESSATLTYNMSSEGEGNFVAYGYIETTTSDVLNFIISTAKDILDRTGLLIGFFIILAAGFAFIWNPTAGIVGVEGAIIFVNVIGLVSFSPVFIFSSIAIAILALILLRS
jgi:hypothetical protein